MLVRNALNILIIAACCSTLVLLACDAGSGDSGSSGKAPAPPRLVVFVVVDQMLPDHFSRFDDLYSGGLKRLYDDGAVFLNGMHHHAATYTATGHATLSTGRFPGAHGIVGNSWFDRAAGNRETYATADSTVHQVGEPGRTGGSPKQMKCDAVGDWLKKASPDSKVFSVSLKDRAAVVMGGQRADGVYWYDRRTATFCTSTYYTSAYPEWVTSFNAAKPADKFFDEGWQRMLPDSAYARLRPDDFPGEGDGGNTTLPFSFKDRFEAPGERYYNWLRAMPFGDKLLIDFAERLLVEEGLGADDVPDLLLLSISATDGCGHTWGPFSHEALDHYCRLDGYLRGLFERLDATVGRDRYAIVLSSDHGVLPLPEELARIGQPGRRQSYNELMADLSAACTDVAGQWSVPADLIADKRGGRLILNYEATDGADIPREQVRSAVAARLREIEYVADVFTYDELKRGDVDRGLAELYQASFDPTRGPDLHVQFEENVLFMGKGTTHGSPYQYDRRVPIVFAGVGIAPGRYDEVVPTVDIAPTIARLLGVTAPDIDGRVIDRALAIR